MSRTTFGPECPKCSRRPYLKLDTRDGRLVEVMLEGCEHERKKRGICRDCNAPVYGKVRQARYCAKHRAERTRKIARDSKRKEYAEAPELHRERARQYREKNPEKVREWNVRYRRSQVLRLRKLRWTDAEVYQRQKRAKREKYATDEAYRERVKAKQAEYRSNPEVRARRQEQDRLRRERQKRERESTQQRRRAA